MTDFTEEEIHKVCGVLETNGFEVPKMNLVAVYGFSSLLEHNCIPNVTRTYDTGIQLVVAASVDIEAGDHIATSYVDPFWGVRARKAYLSTFKYFECHCSRCTDMTDLNTHLSSVICRLCHKGLVIPSYDVTSNWKCDSCTASFDACEVEKRITEIFEQKEQLSNTTTAIERFLKQTKSVLSENHQFRLEAKMILLQLYGSETKKRDFNAKGSPDDRILRRRKLCQEVLEVAGIFSPGTT